MRFSTFALDPLLDTRAASKSNIAHGFTRIERIATDGGGAGAAWMRRIDLSTTYYGDVDVQGCVKVKNSTRIERISTDGGGAGAAWMRRIDLSTTCYGDVDVALT